ncbi:MAG: glycosyltransferase family 4 protein [Candidatus Omnitrophica bacterium]|nr:glycosyltransferase family 4 protein [Candidatus Omnitrophota bacterium]
MNVLFLSPVPLEGAGCRVRIIQYLPSLRAAGIEGTVRPFMDEAFFAIAYQPGRWGRKAVYFLNAVLRRFRDCLRSRDYDVVYIYRECAPIGPPIFEWLLLVFRRPIVYDLDDAIHLPGPQERFQGRVWQWLKWHPKVPWMLRHCAHAVVGNRYLEAYAKQFTAQVTVLPTPEDPARFRDGPPAASNGPLTIGWIGTHSTASYLLQLVEVFQALARRYAIRVAVVGAGRPIHMPGVMVENVPWSLQEESRLVQGFNIGVYPLGGSEFDRGKACYKAVLYMAAGVPLVASNFGANRDLIQDGVNGLLASSPEEWSARLAELIEQPDLRARLGQAGRRTVAQRYSVVVNAPALIHLLQSAASAGRRAKS